MGAHPGYALSCATVAPHRPARAAMRARCTSMACVRLLRVDMMMVYLASESLELLGFTAARLLEVSTSPVQGSCCLVNNNSKLAQGEGAMMHQCQERVACGYNTASCW